jgi:hypothetical protein
MKGVSHQGEQVYASPYDWSSERGERTIMLSESETRAVLGLLRRARHCLLQPAGDQTIEMLERKVTQR